MSIPQSVAEILREHVSLENEGIALSSVSWKTNEDHLDGKARAGIHELTKVLVFSKEDARLLNGKLHNHLIWSARIYLFHRLYIIGRQP